MKIDQFLNKINYQVLSGEIYQGQCLQDKLLYWIHFTDKFQKNKGKLLVSAKNQHIYYIEYAIYHSQYVYCHKMMEKQKNTQSITLKNMLNLLET